MLLCLAANNNSNRHISGIPPLTTFVLFFRSGFPVPSFLSNCYPTSATLPSTHVRLYDNTIVEYESYPSRVWQPALYERVIVEKLLAEQFSSFVDRVKTTDCQAELRRLLAAGPPLYLADKHALALARDSDTHVSRLWFASDNTTRSAKLTGAPEGEAREVLWTELREFLIVDGKEEGDDDDQDSKEVP